MTDTDADRSNVTQATFLEFYDELVSAKAAVDGAQGTYRNILKRAKGANVNIDMLRASMKLANQDRLRRETDFRDLQQMMIWLEKPLGTQGSLDLPETAPASTGDKDAAATHLLNEAEREGVEAGKHGANIASCPYQVGTEHHQRWTTGWHSGQREAVGAGPGRSRRAPAPAAEA